MFLDFASFKDELRTSYHKGLPGREAQYKMAPLGRPKFQDLDYYLNHSKQSAVLVTCFELRNLPHILLIERTEDLSVHSKQIGFPGGKKDQKDSDLYETAMREFDEEVGKNSHHVELVGPLTPLYIPVSNYYVQPFLGFVNSEAEFRKNDKEVKELIFLPLNKLLDGTLICEQKIKLGNGVFQKVPAFVFEEKVIWGATAMILSELRQMLV